MTAHNVTCNRFKDKVAISYKLKSCDECTDKTRAYVMRKQENIKEYKFFYHECIPFTKKARTRTHECRICGDMMCGPRMATHKMSSKCKKIADMENTNKTTQTIAYVNADGSYYVKRYVFLHFFSYCEVCKKL